MDNLRNETTAFLVQHHLQIVSIHDVISNGWQVYFVTKLRNHPTDSVISYGMLTDSNGAIIGTGNTYSTALNSFLSKISKKECYIPIDNETWQLITVPNLL